MLEEMYDGVCERQIIVTQLRFTAAVSVVENHKAIAWHLS